MIGAVALGLALSAFIMATVAVLFARQCEMTRVRFERFLAARDGDDVQREQHEEHDHGRHEGYEDDLA